MPDDSIEVGDYVNVYGHEWKVVEVDSAHGGDLVVERVTEGRNRHRLLVPPGDVIIRIRPPVEVRIPLRAARGFLSNPTVQQKRPTFLVPEEWPVAASQRVVIEYVDPQIPISETVVVKRWEIVKDCLFLRITDEESQVVPLSQIRRWRSVAIETDGDR